MKLDSTATIGSDWNTQASLKSAEASKTHTREQVERVIAQTDDERKLEELLSSGQVRTDFARQCLEERLKV